MKRFILWELACSQGLGFPSWGDLINDLFQKFRHLKIQYCEESSLLDNACRLKTELESKKILKQYYSYFYQKFKGPPPKFADEWPDSRLHELLLQFPIKSLLTTNYDHALEYYIKVKNKNIHVDNVLPFDPGPAGDFLFSLKDKKLFQNVLHLHGGYKNSENIILTRKDYDRAYKGYFEEDGQIKICESPHRKILWTLLSTRCLIFIGFSLTDDYINDILSEVCSDLWGSFTEKHFAIVPYDPENEIFLKDKKDIFLKNYSIQTIFYNIKNDHKELLDLLEFLQNKKQQVVSLQQDEFELTLDEKKDLLQKMRNINKKALPSYE